MAAKFLKKVDIGGAEIRIGPNDKDSYQATAVGENSKVFKDAVSITPSAGYQVTTSLAYIWSDVTVIFKVTNTNAAASTMPSNGSEVTQSGFVGAGVQRAICLKPNQYISYVSLTTGIVLIETPDCAELNS